MRLRQENADATEFADMLLAIGDGRQPYEDHVDIPARWVIDTTDPGALIRSIYPFIDSEDPIPDHYSQRAILAATNADVNYFNDEALSLFPGDAREYFSIDKVLDADDPDGAATDYPIEYLHSIITSGIPRHELLLKVGMPLIILRNMDPEAGLCNGTKVFVTRLLDRCIAVRRLDQGNNGREHFLPRVNMCTNEGDYPFILCRRQFPVRPAFAMTIHKSQGQTLSVVGILLNHPVFVHGQLYVALSRVTNPTNLHIGVKMDSVTDSTRHTLPNASHTTSNIVYREVLFRPNGSSIAA